jgi:hypothetical protein
MLPAQLRKQGSRAMSITPTQFWIEGGWFMYPVALAGGMGVLVAIASLFLRDKEVARIAVLLILAGGLLGVVGNLYNRKHVEAAIVAVSPELQERVREVGLREAMRPAQLGGGLFAVGLPLAVLGLALAMRRKAR